MLWSASRIATTSWLSCSVANTNELSAEKMRWLGASGTLICRTGLNVLPGPSP